MSNFSSKFSIGNNISLAKRLIFIQISLVLIQDFLIYTLHFPSVLAYINDIITFLILIFSYNIVMKTVKCIKIKAPIICIVIFSIVCVLGVVINKVPLLLFIYGVRQTFRFFIFFVCCFSILESSDIKRFYKLVLHFQIINIILVLFQYFILKQKGDYLGGIFGTVLSCNAPLNLFLCVVNVFAISFYLNKKETLLNLIWIVITSLSIAGLAELKFFFLEFIIIVIACLLLCRPTRKMFFLLAFIVLVSIIVGLIFLKCIFPQQFEILTNPSKLIYYLTATDYSGAYTVSRTKFIEQISTFFFKDNFIHQLFGYGLGNCEYSSIDFLRSEFFNAWGGSYNYNWFSSSMRYLETGALGLITYLFFYISIIMSGFKLSKKSMHNENNSISIVMAIMAILCFFYNDSLTKYIGYLLVLVLSFYIIDSIEYNHKEKINREISNLKGKNKIPKVIHYCWFGGKPLNDLSIKCIASWEKHLPDYEIKRWDELNFDIKINSYVKEAYESGKYAFVSDYARLYIIYNYGGIYFDTDVEVLQGFDKIIENGNFFGTEKTGHISTGLGFAAEPKNKLIKLMLDDYENINFVNANEIDITPCPIRNTNSMEKIGYICKNKLRVFKDFTIYPNEYFCPKDYETNQVTITENTVLFHHYSASWYDSNDVEEIKTKNKYIGLFGVAFGLFIFKVIRKLKRYK